MRADPVGNLAARAVGIGADPSDASYVRESKGLLVGVSLMVLPAGVLWGALYWAFGEPGAALLPWTYTACSIVFLAVFSRTHSFRSSGPLSWL